MANSFSSAASLTERFLVPSVTQSNPNPGIEEVGNDNASDNDDEVLSVGGVSLPPSPQPVSAVASGTQTVLAHPQPDEMESTLTPREPATASSRVEQNAVLECDHKPSIKVSDVEADLNARRTMRSSPEEVPADECPSTVEGDVELPRTSPLFAQDPSSSPFEPDVDGGECTSPQQSAALKFSIDNILNPNFGRSLLPASTTTAVTRELLHRHPHLYCHPLITAAKEMLLAVTAAEMSPAAPAPASNYLVRDNTHQSTPNHLHFNPHLAALQINHSNMNQQPHVLSATSGMAGKNNSANKLSSNAFYATWRTINTINTNNRSDHVSCLTPPSSAGTVMDLSLRSANGYAAGGSLSSPSRGSASPGGISTCSSSSSGDSSSQHQSSFTGTGTVANPPATCTTKLAANAGALVSSASATPTNNESSTESGSASQPNLLWPAWVYCTRYSDRPSSGPRARRIRKKDKKPDEKRPRTAFTAEQLARLKTEFNENRYLTEKRRQDLARELQLHENQIKIWFQNKRAKIKKASGQKNPLALQLMAQGLYNHSTIPLRDDEDIDSME